MNIYIKIYFIIKIKFIKIKNYLITNFYFLTNLNYYKLKFINKKNKKLKITRKELIQNIKVFVQQIQNFKNIQNIIIQPLYNYIKNKKIISKFYIRKSKFFNKTKYSFIRQECKNIVHFSLILNVLLVLITFHVCLHWNFTTNYPILFLFLILIFNINIIFKIKQIWFFFIMNITIMFKYILNNYYKIQKNKFLNYYKIHDYINYEYIKINYKTKQLANNKLMIKNPKMEFYCNNKNIFIRLLITQINWKKHNIQLINQINKTEKFWTSNYITTKHQFLIFKNLILNLYILFSKLNFLFEFNIKKNFIKLNYFKNILMYINLILNCKLKSNIFILIKKPNFFNINFQKKIWIH